MQTATFTQKPTVFATPRLKPTPPSNLYGWGLDTSAQLKAERDATWLLIKAGFFPKGEERMTEEYHGVTMYSDVIPPAECCGSSGMKPLWHAELPRPDQFIEDEALGYV